MALRPLLHGSLGAVASFSQLFHRCQRAVQALPGRARRARSDQEERLLRNVVASLAQALQELSASFRHAQSGYLRRECPRESWTGFRGMKVPALGPLFVSILPFGR